MVIAITDTNQHAERRPLYRLMQYHKYYISFQYITCPYTDRGMRHMRKTMVIICALMVIGTSLGGTGSASYENKSELNSPDETYFDIEGDPASEEKGEERGGSPYSVSVDSLMKGEKEIQRSPITFPYEKFNWSIDTWYKSSHGLRFYNVQFEDEKILYDYRLPWVKIDNTKYNLTSAMRSDGPDLYVYNTAKAFKVWIEYYIAAENVHVEVYVYFLENGEMDPWAIVDCGRSNKDIVVGQRFDFDLGGAGDDNALFYTDNGWDLCEEEDDHPDENEPEDDYLQWELADTDVDGSSFVIDQSVGIIPYHTDNSRLHIVRYHPSQIGGDPSDFDGATQDRGAWWMFKRENRCP